MTIWSSEINALKELHHSVYERYPRLAGELSRLVKTDDENMVLVYSRRCLEIVVADICEQELDRPRGTEPLKGIIDKLRREEIVPHHIIASMANINSISSFGAHPKQFELQQVKPVLLDLTTTLQWYLNYSESRKPGSEINARKVIEETEETATGKTGSSRKRILKISAISLAGVITLGLILYMALEQGTERIDDSLDKSVAVLPFHNLSGDPGQEYICDGLTDEIISNLFKVRSFDEVRSFTSVLPYKDSHMGISEIAAALDVNYVLEGSYKRMGDEIKITAQLIEPGRDNHIWLKDYNMPFSEVMGIPGEIAFQIVDHMKVYLIENEKRRIDQEATDNIDAYDLYMLGRYHWNMRTREGIMKSIEYFKQATRIDSDYALAYAGLADAYGIAADWNFIDFEVACRNAKEYALEAIRIDAQLARPYSNLAGIATFCENNHPLADSLYQRAIRLNPSYATGRQWYALFLMRMGETGKAIREIQKALELDPYSLIIRYAAGQIYYLSEEWESSLEQLNKTLEMNPEFTHPTLITKFKCLMQMGEDQRALEVFGRYGEDKDYQLHFRSEAYRIFADSGRDATLRYLARLEYNSIRPSPRMLGFLYAFTGNKQKAIDQIEYMIRHKEQDYAFFHVEPAYGTLRSEPRFRALVSEMGYSNEE